MTINWLWNLADVKEALSGSKRTHAFEDLECLQHDEVRVTSSSTLAVQVHISACMHLAGYVKASCGIAERSTFFLWCLLGATGS